MLKLFVEIENCCEICTENKQPGLKPIVGFSLFTEFNDTVLVDLREISGARFLHIIANATRLSTYSSCSALKMKGRNCRYLQ